MKNIIKILLFIPLFIACDDLFSPALENNRGLEDMYEEAAYAQGILANGYTRIPTSSWSFNDVATDDAVSNDKDNNYMKMATGQWTSSVNPLERWRDAKAAIHYLNLFLSESDKVKWAIDEKVSEMFNDRMKGEAYGLRALFMFHLLQNHAGWTEDGVLLGVPIITEPEVTTSNFNIPRNNFDDCVLQIYDDIERAEELLPLDYNNISNINEIPEKYRNNGIEVGEYNRVFGDLPRLRMTARIAKAIRAQTSLLAASPAYNEGSSTTWSDVANYAAQVLDLIGGVDGLDPKGLTWYANHDEIEGLSDGLNPKEILWRGGTSIDLDLEAAHFPPSLYGNGRLNPTQDLVNAFPMENGYPIDDNNSGYDEKNPYYGRDPRLTKYIIVNGSTAGHDNSEIITAVDGLNNDAFGKVETSTRTGYYMRKLLRQDVNLNPNSQNKQKHYKPHIRYTEIFLIYAEAANEAYGPTGKGPHAYSAYDVIKAMRKRAGIGLDNQDPYLESIKEDRDKMRKLIRNERRLELCFEGFRFWDLRRWKEKIDEPAQGNKILNNIHNTISVENRVYSDYMYYGPIPYSEVIKFDNLVQNKGW